MDTRALKFFEDVFNDLFKVFSKYADENDARERARNIADEMTTKAYAYDESVLPDVRKSYERSDDLDKIDFVFGTNLSQERWEMENKSNIISEAFRRR